MSNKLYAFLLGLVLTAAMLAHAGNSQATLGKSADSIVADQEALLAVGPSTTVCNGYTVQMLGSDAVVVREYISPAGIVFAISWDGMIHPDLTPLMGSYAGKYEASLKRTPYESGRSHLRVMSDQVVVEKWGHMRNLQGRAYVPALIPAGVSIDEIK